VQEHPNKPAAMTTRRRRRAAVAEERFFREAAIILKQIMHLCSHLEMYDYTHIYVYIQVLLYFVLSAASCRL
jgi:hypothetical protein